MANTVKIDIEKVRNSYETINSIETCVSNHNFHNYFCEMEKYITSVNEKHNNCIKGYKGKLNEINESVDKIKNKINLLSDSLSKTINSNNKVVMLSENQAELIRKNTTDSFQYKKALEPVTNNDNTQIIVPVPEIENNKSIIPEGYNTTPIGLGIAAAGITGAIGAVVIDSTIPKSYKQNKQSSEIDNDENEYIEYEIAEEAEEKPLESLKIEQSMTSYQASRDKESMKKFYDDIDED